MPRTNEFPRTGFFDIVGVLCLATTLHLLTGTHTGPVGRYLVDMSEATTGGTIGRIVMSVNGALWLLLVAMWATIHAIEAITRNPPAPRAHDGVFGADGESIRRFG